MGYLATTRFHNWHRVVKSFFRNYYTLYTDGDYNEFRVQFSAPRLRHRRLDKYLFGSDVLQGFVTNEFGNLCCQFTKAFMPGFNVANNRELVLHTGMVNEGGQTILLLLTQAGQTR